VSHRNGLFVVLALCLAAPAAAQTAVQPASCDAVGQNLYVRDVLHDLYLWYRELPELDAAAFASPEAYLEAVRYRPLDNTFSFIASRAETEAFYSASQFLGFGFTSVFSGPGELRLAEVMPGSPAQEANLARGDRIVDINGRSVQSLRESGELDAAFGPAQPGVVIDVVAVRDGNRFRARMAKRMVTIPTVSATHVVAAGNRQIGYLFFRNFVEPSYAALDEAFARLRNGSVDDLIVDLRYNGGGLVAVAQHLASQIAGTRADGGVFAEYAHNDRHPALNRVVRFRARPGALSLPRVVFITTRASASASELVINALRPYIDVQVVGERTYGKPVGQYTLYFCDKMLAPVSFALRNARGEGDYFDGIAPTCAAGDDLDHAIGDDREASLREALTLVTTGRCSTPAAAATLRPSRASQPQDRAAGWRSIVNAW
jgi:C-terminal peptidase prc